MLDCLFVGWLGKGVEYRQHIETDLTLNRRFQVRRQHWLQARKFLAGCLT
jgi:hypothetical protein